MDAQKIRAFALRMRRMIIEMSHQCNMSAHLGGGLSMVEINAILFGAIMRLDPKNPRWTDRDRYILSKGHGVLGYFSALHAVGFISAEKLKTFLQNESDLIAHPVMNMEFGIESSNGSLGHGLSMAVGVALAAKRHRQAYHIYVLLGDGECNEGAVWEAMMLAAQYQLDNLTAIVDMNGYQSDGKTEHVINLKNMADRSRQFGWNVQEVDGHDIDNLYQAFCSCTLADQPHVVIARTVKGKGISFMENNNDWHHARLTKNWYEQAVMELDGKTSCST